MERTMRSPFIAPATAGVIAIAAAAPLSAPAHASLDPQVASVLLAATTDPVTSWQDVFDQWESNFADLSEHFWTYFFPALQQEAVNRVGLIEDFFLHPFQAPALLNEFFNLIKTAINAHVEPFVSPNDFLYGSVDEEHDAYLQSFADALGGSNPWSVDFFASAYSGLLLGNILPFVGVDLQFFDDISDIVKDIFSLHLKDAFQSFLDIPANVVNALLNGYGTLDLPDIPVSALFPAVDSDAVITSINIGGIVSPGGSLFGSLGLSGAGLPDVAGEPFGTFGSIVSMQEAIAVAIGWSGEGNPIEHLGELFDFGM